MPQTATATPAEAAARGTDSLQVATFWQDVPPYSAPWCRWHLVGGQSQHFGSATDVQPASGNVTNQLWTTRPSAPAGRVWGFSEAGFMLPFTVRYDGYYRLGAGWSTSSTSVRGIGTVRTRAFLMVRNVYRPIDVQAERFVDVTGTQPAALGVVAYLRRNTLYRLTVGGVVDVTVDDFNPSHYVAYGEVIGRVNGVFAALFTPRGLEESGLDAEAVAALEAEVAAPREAADRGEEEVLAQEPIDLGTLFGRT